MGRCLPPVRYLNELMYGAGDCEGSGNVMSRYDWVSKATLSASGTVVIDPGSATIGWCSVRERSKKDALQPSIVSPLKPSASVRTIRSTSETASGRPVLRVCWSHGL
eukprot:2675862-Prymnesium_polylepis.1